MYTSKILPETLFFLYSIISYVSAMRVLKVMITSGINVHNEISDDKVMPKNQTEGNHYS
jgi:hypothetical protein